MCKTLEKEKSIILEISIKNKNHVMNHFRLNYLTLLRLTRLHQNFVIPIKKSVDQAIFITFLFYMLCETIVKIIGGGNNHRQDKCINSLDKKI